MGDIEFRDPVFLLLAALAPLAFWIARRTPAVIRYSSLTLPDAGPRSLRVRLAVLPALLMAVTVALAAIAIAGPRTPESESQVSREGIAIMMVIDRSGSMQARDLVKDDYSVDRLSVVKDVFRQFVLGEGSDAGEGRPNDTIGLIAFAGYADSLCPLTLDHGNLTSMVDDLEIVSRRDEDGTAIGDGLALAVERLRQSPAKSKIAILLTDGVHNSGVIDPRQAAEVAKASDVKVYCIGTGSQGRAPYPIEDRFSGRTQLRLVEVELDEDTLRSIAEETGGRYFRATDREGLAAVYREIDQMERTKITEVRYLRYSEHFQKVLLACLVVMGLAVVSKSTLFRVLP